LKSLAIGQLEEAIMTLQIVMDHTGDSRHSFNPNDARELAKAEQRFYELTRVGFTAAVRTGPDPSLTNPIVRPNGGRNPLFSQAGRRVIAFPSCSGIDRCRRVAFRA
jgi:hypothetical protein